MKKNIESVSITFKISTCKEKNMFNIMFWSDSQIDDNKCNVQSCTYDFMYLIVLFVL